MGRRTCPREIRRSPGRREPWIQLSIVPFIIAILRYALLVDQGKGSAPEDVILHDRQMQVMGVLWALCLVIGIYA